MKKFLYLSISILLVIIAVALAAFPERMAHQDRYSESFHSVFRFKLNLAEQILEDIEVSDYKASLDATKSASSHGITIVSGKDGKLKFWSDNNFPSDILKLDSLSDQSLWSAPSSTYYTRLKEKEGSLVAALILLEKKYPYQNKFLENGIPNEFRLPAGSFITSSEEEKGIAIKVDGNQTPFKIIIPDELEDSKPQKIIATVLLFIALIAFLYFLWKWIDESEGQNFYYKLIGSIALLVIIRVFLLPTMFLSENFVLFGPFYYASRMAPSLGCMIANSIIFLFLSLIIYRHLGSNYKPSDKQKSNYVFISVYNLVYIIFFAYAYYASYSLVFNSNIHFKTNEIQEIGIGTVLGYFVFAIHFAGVAFIGLWVVTRIYRKNFYQLVLNVVLWLMVLFTIGLMIDKPLDLISLSFGIVWFVLIAFLYGRGLSNSMFSYLVFFALIFTLYILSFVIYHVNQKEDLHKKSLVESLANEHDPVAEHLFVELSQQIRSDSLIFEALTAEVYDAEKLHGYLQKNYFTGFWKKYNFQITVCTPHDSIYFELPEFESFHCYSFFDTIKAQIGLQIPNTSFEYLDENTGRILYLGQFAYNHPSLNQEVKLYIELDSKLTSETLGYPELLLDDKLRKPNLYEGYSYGKYYQGKLISQSGSFDYSLSSKVFEVDQKGKFQKVDFQGYNHLLYRADSMSLVIISRDSISALDLLVIFSYLFVFYYLLILVVAVIVRLRFFEKRLVKNFRSRMQFSVISILLFSLVLIAGSTIWFNVRKFKQNQYSILEEKIQSVYVELEHKLAYEDELTNRWSAEKYDNLNQLLIKFSDVFYSDINLYNPEGNLLATSRAEVFDLGLLGKKMDPEAYYKMHEEQLAQFIHREQINNLSYLSAYIPFTNFNGELLAYLNLPYFTKQQDLQEDITTLVVAIINIYVILILITIVIAVIIADQITRPLEILQEKLRSIKLGGKFERIHYDRHDEVGNLVKEYNKMVLELEESVDKLAKSERESAWREMAKQIAHEIKNPLTPMRLSMQQLQRSWKDDKEDFEGYLNQVTKTIIEQIDNLTTIANEFSNFAQMPQTVIEDVSILSIVNNAVLLFDSNDRYSIQLKTNGADLWVKADKEQLLRIFINLIKNAIQSIPAEKEGLVKVDVVREGKYAVITIEDNGKGIPEEIKAKLFRPNFTTKTSGMGLGLAIVKSSLEQVGGEISFRSEIGTGSTFIVKIPCSQ